MSLDHPSAKEYAKQIEDHIHGAENAWSRPDHQEKLRLNAADAIVKLHDEMHDLMLDPEYARLVGKQLLKDGVTQSEVEHFLPGAKVVKGENGKEEIEFAPIGASVGKNTDERIEHAAKGRNNSPAEYFQEKLEEWMPGNLRVQQLAWKHMLSGWIGTPDITPAEMKEVERYIPKNQGSV